MLILRNYFNKEKKKWWKQISAISTLWGRKDEDIFKKLNEQVLDELVKIKEVIADEHDEAIPIPKHTAAHFLTT